MAKMIDPPTPRYGYAVPSPAPAPRPVDATSNTYPAWQQRVFDEKRELDDRRHKLTVFLADTRFEDLDPIDRELLRTQHTLMTSYSATLAQRIARFK